MQLNSYLMFDGNCEAAFKFYEQCLGGKITMMTHKEAPSAENVPPELHDKIMHVCLDLGVGGASPSENRLLMGFDCPPGYFEPPQGFYVQVSVPEPEEAERVFHALAENGKVKMPVSVLRNSEGTAQTFWSVRFGMLIDQFGTPWMVNCEQIN